MLRNDLPIRDRRQIEEDFPMENDKLCIRALIEEGARRNPGSVAIAAPGRPPLSYGRLLSHVADVARRLNELGFGGNDRIALVLPNGPEMAVAFLAVASAAACAPLNPAYRENEFDFYLSDLNAGALIVQEGMGAPAVAVARDRGIPVFTLSPAYASDAGIFRFSGAGDGRRNGNGAPGPGDTALVLHTSGTTSRPKIVPLTQANLCISARNIRETLRLREPDRCLNVMPLFHIHGLVGATLSSISAGASVACLPGFDVAGFFGGIEEFRPTWYTAVPTIHQSILAAAERNRKIISRFPLRFIRSSSSALPRRVMTELEAAFHAPVIESYGMTEASHQMASNPLPPGVRKPGSVGIAAGPAVAVMDGEGKLLEAGRTGEVVIRGDNVTSGYGNDPAANDRAFAGGWLRTGDQGYLDGDGYLFLTGRLKEIINRGGLKISPQEVDDALLAHPGVAQAITFAIPHPTLGEDVAAAVVLAGNRSASEREIREFAFSRLAEYKVPSRVLILEDIPKGPTGKPQRSGLAGKLKHALEAVFVAPRTREEEILAAIWADVLGIGKIGVHDNFFLLGGDSLKAAQVVARLRDLFRVELPLRGMFQSPTLEEMASILETNEPGPPHPSIARRSDQEPIPLSFAQQRMWVLDQMDPGTYINSVSRALSLSGPLDVDALERSLEEILRRHEGLRTTFPLADGTPVQVIAPHRARSLPVTDLREVPESGRKDHARQLAMEEFRRPFDLSGGPLFRAALLRLEEKEHVLLVTMHHIVSDGWSMGVLFREMAPLYEAFSGGKPSPLAELSVQYADFSQWQRRWLQGEVLEKQLSYWKRQLAGELPVLDLPTDRPRPPVQTYNGATCSLMLPRELSESLNALSRKEGVTLFMTLLAAFQVLLHRFSGKDDILVGTPIANRNPMEIEGLIGLFVNTLVLRTDLSGAPGFLELLRRVRETALGAYEHQDLPFEKLVEAIRPERDVSRTPIFQTMFQLRNIPGKTSHFPGLEVRDFDVPVRTSNFDLSVDVTEEDEGLFCLFEYNTDMFDHDTVRRMLGHYRTLLAGIAADPERKISMLPLLTDPERNRVLVEWNDTHSDFPEDRCIHQLFEAQVERTPSAVAVWFAGKALTYRDLNARANRLAGHLRKRGVGPDILVGVCMERSVEMVVGILGVLKAGGAYVPLDPMSPKERLGFMLEDIRTPVLLTQENLSGTLPSKRPEVICVDSGWDALARESDANAAGGAGPEDLAYVIYTSGSTGNPKGVMISHRALSNNIAWARRMFRISPSDAVLQVASFSFDASISEIFLPLLSGAKLVMALPRMQYDGKELLDLVAEQEVTTVELVPSLLKVLLEEKGFRDCRGLQRVICGGETLSVDLRDRFFETVPAELYNIYGPTETTIDATCMVCRRGDGAGNVPIGRPIANFQAYVLDRNLQPVPVGVPGELCIGGAGLARGYLNRPDLTEEKFIPNPFSGETGARIYRTGDLVRYLPDGNIEFLDRIDNQVKIRGYRVELGEIEAALRAHPKVDDAVVLLKGDGEGKRLVAYLVPKRRSSSPADGEVREFLKRTLPDYMVPASYVRLERFPRIPSGKVDRRALPDPAAEKSGPGDTFVAPRDEVENHLKEIWQWVLDVRPIGIRDNFFELGGHSLLAVRLFAHIEKFFGKSLPLSALFHAPTIEELAREIRQEGLSFKWNYLVPVHPYGSRPPFFCVHPHDGDAFRFWDLAVSLGADQPFYGLRAKILKDDRSFHHRIEEMATAYIDEMRSVQPHGPYFLGGHCFGGVVAVEMARQLGARGEDVALVALIFSHAPGYPKRKAKSNFLLDKLYDAFMKIDGFLMMFPLVEPEKRISYIKEILMYNHKTYMKRLKRMFYELYSSYGDSYLADQEKRVHGLGEQISAYVPKVYPGRLTLFRAQKESLKYLDTEECGWGDLAAGGVEVHKVPGYPNNQDFKPRVRVLAGKLEACLVKAQQVPARA
jgi:amino acid adenylation domain-containing protein